MRFVVERVALEQGFQVPRFCPVNIIPPLLCIHLESQCFEARYLVSIAVEYDQNTEK
jgi:hypothetical protein